MEGCEATKVSKPSLSWQMSEPDLHTLKVHTELSDPVLCNRSAVSAPIQSSYPYLELLSGALI